MPYCFRLKVQMLTAISPHDEPFYFETPLFPPIKTTNLGSADIGTWISFKSCEFSSEHEAANCGRRFSDALLASGAIHRLGVHIGFDRESPRFSSVVVDELKQKFGKQLRGDTHGLAVFEKDRTQIIRVSAKGTMSITPEILQNKILPMCADGFSLTEKQRVCAALLNDSFFVADESAQFILRISATEALCDQSDTGQEYQRLLEHLLAYLESLQEDSDAKGSVKRKLLDAKRSSIRQAYLRKFKLLTDANDANEFDRLYGLRSNLVHEGKGRGDLLNASIKAMDLATKLLEADISAAQHRPL